MNYSSLIFGMLITMNVFSMDRQPDNINSLIQHIRSGNTQAVSTALTEPLSHDEYKILKHEATELNIRNSLVNGWLKPARTLCFAALLITVEIENPIIKFGISSVIGSICIINLVLDVPKAIKTSYTAYHTPADARARLINAADDIGLMLDRKYPMR